MDTIKIKRGTDLERQGVIFPLGEPVYCTDTKKLYIGDGVTPGGVAVTSDTNLNDIIQQLEILFWMGVY